MYVIYLLLRNSQEHCYVQYMYIPSYSLHRDKTSKYDYASFFFMLHFSLPRCSLPKLDDWSQKKYKKNIKKTPPFSYPHICIYIRPIVRLIQPETTPYAHTSQIRLTNRRGWASQTLSEDHDQRNR